MHVIARFLTLPAVLCLSMAPALGEIDSDPVVQATPVQPTNSGTLFPAPIDWPADTALARRQDYFVILQQAQTLLETIALEAGLRLSISDQVNGVARNLRLTGTTSEVLDTVTATLGLDWFIFNGIVHVSSRSEATTRIIRLGDLTSDQVIESIGAAGLTLDRLEIRHTVAGNLLTLSGPPDLLAIAEAMIDSMPSPAAARPILEAPAPARTVLVRRGNEEQRVTLR